LDDRYFKGLEGQYDFKLYFRLHFSDRLGGDDYIARSHGNCVMFRSVVAELPILEEGTYSVVVNVAAERKTDVPSVEKMVQEMCRDSTDSYHGKFSQVGFSYNVAHLKGASVVEAQMKKRKGEEKRNAWKQRHEARKRVARKSTARRKVAKTAVVIPLDPTVDKTKDIGKSSVLKQPATLGTSLSTTLPPLRNVGSVDRDVTQSPDEMSSFTMNTSLVVGQATLDQATQTEVRPQNRDGEDPDQAEEYVSSEYHTDTDSVNSYGSQYEYRPLSYDPPPAEDGDNIDPWNAVCVVGLRIYSKDPNLRIEVVMPGEGRKPGLDIDNKQAGVPAEVQLDESKDKSPELPVRMKMNQEPTN
jgi:hypothetical protein